MTFRPEFHVAHEPAGTFQQAVRIGNLGATKESDVNVSLQGVDVGECRIRDTCGGMTVM